MITKLSDAIVQAVWEKGCLVQGNNPSIFRKDQCGAWIKREDYGNTISAYGWEIDHIRPIADGGNDATTNLRPLHWKNNRVTSDGRLTCPVRSSGNRNVGL